MKGMRKLIFGAYAIAALGAGFAASIIWKEGAVSFPAFATAVVSVTVAVVAGNVGEHIASRPSTDAAPNLRETT